ncbi:hypothetical protein [Microbacterium xanthum]|uniref:hypothetical protein n=1 Tax=Microbacterium xanthum TaxID=3079794 RepID=UPI002AD3B59C|nr:hypothetical protein [Microbacterium sp. KSW-48]MDZ8172439.1 hypothetical protein [Microbacterium sp. KSW-48]
MVSETGVLDYQSLRVAWDCAAGLVRTRPWLTISWIAHPGEDWHLVVHDGATGPALHFDDYPGPTLAGKSGVSSLDWDDVIPPSEVIDWTMEWGPADIGAELTPKTAVYELLSALVALGPSWSVQPARFIGYDGDPSSVYTLQKVFPTIAQAVDFYSEMLEGQHREGELAGRSEYWHEPLWLVAVDGIATAVVDEGGDLHVSASASRGASAFKILRTLRDRDWAIDELAQAVAEGSSIAEDSAPESSHPSALTSSQKLRVYIDFASIMSPSDWEAVRRVRESGSRVEDTKLLWTVGREFADAFGEDWWSLGLPGAISGGVEWTLHIGRMGIGTPRIDLLYLAASELFTGYFFTGCKLLIDRLGVADCDIYVTRDAAADVRRGPAEVIRVGTKGFEDWRIVASYISGRARR